MASKLLKIGQVKKQKRKDGSEFEVMELDFFNLKAFTQLLRGFGMRHLTKVDGKDENGKDIIIDLTPDELKVLTKMKWNDPAKVNPPRILRFDKKPEDYQDQPNRRATPEWILADLCVDVEELSK